MSIAEDPKRRRLGRGLSALLGEAEPEAAAAAPAAGPRTLPVEHLVPGRFQPRRAFDEAAIDDLVGSIREKGILQPILVRRHPERPDSYEIIAGERRWRAAQKAMLHEVPVIVRDLSDEEALEVGLIENLQRQDLSALEEAEGYRRLMEEFRRTQEDLARAVGKSRSHVANTMRLLALPEPVKHLLEGGELSAGHARALLASADPVAAARQVVAKGLNVRQTEKLVQRPPTAPAKGVRHAAPPPAKDVDTLALERDLSNLLGLKVSIRFEGGGGELVIRYASLEQLDDILHRLNQAAAVAADG